MCVAIVKPAGVVFPAIGVMKKCWDANPDGAGYACSGNRDVWISKGFMTWTEFETVYNRLLTRPGLVSRALMFHFRIGTHGLKDAGNTHPFPVSADPSVLRTRAGRYPSAVMHNGIFSNTVKAKDVSDTGQFIIDSVESGKGILEFWDANRTMTGTSKFCVLLPGNRFDVRGGWSCTDDCGCLFSNLLWKYRTSYVRNDDFCGTGWNGGNYGYDENWGENWGEKWWGAGASKRKAVGASVKGSGFHLKKTDIKKIETVTRSETTGCVTVVASHGGMRAAPVANAEGLTFDKCDRCASKTCSIWDEPCYSCLFVREHPAFSEKITPASSSLLIRNSCTNCRHFKEPLTDSQGKRNAACRGCYDPGKRQFTGWASEEKEAEVVEQAAAAVKIPETAAASDPALYCDCCVHGPDFDASLAKGGGVPAVCNGCTVNTDDPKAVPTKFEALKEGVLAVKAAEKTEPPWWSNAAVAEKIRACLTGVAPSAHE